MVTPSSVPGLCNDSLNQVMKDMPPPTNEDLQGFWEMVCLQVENVDEIFAELERTRANDWKVSIFLNFAQIQNDQTQQITQRCPNFSTFIFIVNASQSI